MQFLLIAHDGHDAKALERRLAARPSHIALGDKLHAAGKLLYGAAILDDADTMVGSVFLCDFTDRRELDEWLKIEPYMTGEVWQKVEIKKCRVGPSFIPK